MSEKPYDYYFQSNEGRDEYISRLLGLTWSLFTGSFLGCLFSVAPAVVLSTVIGFVDLFLFAVVGISIGTEITLGCIGLGILLTHHNMIKIFEGNNFFGRYVGNIYLRPIQRQTLIFLGNTLIFIGIFQFFGGVAEGLFRAIF